MAIPTVMQGKLSIPVVGSPLFIISNPDLVIAQCKAGIVGSFPSLNARPLSVLDGWLKQISTELAAYDAANPDSPSAPFAVNQIVHKSNDRLEDDMALCEQYKVPIVITSLGAQKEVNDRFQSQLTISHVPPPLYAKSLYFIADRVPPLGVASFEIEFDPTGKNSTTTALPEIFVGPKAVANEGLGFNDDPNCQKLDFDASDGLMKSIEMQPGGLGCNANKRKEMPKEICKVEILICE